MDLSGPIERKCTNKEEAHCAKLTHKKYEKPLGESIILVYSLYVATQAQTSTVSSSYTMRELECLHSYRQGEQIKAKSLAGAKRAASKRQFFVGTVLVLENAQGERIAYKKGGKWTDIQDWS